MRDRGYRELGPGYLESIYEEAMAVALRDAGLRFERQVTVQVYFRGHIVGTHRLDSLVEDKVVMELKAVSDLDDVFFVIVRSYLKATSKPCGLLLNFAAPVLGIRRVGPEFLRRLTSQTAP
jgi:GxxExxY protein